MRTYIIRLILFASLLKLVYYGTTFIVASFNQSYSISPSFNEFISLFKRADSYWYEKVADRGYPKIYSEEELGYSRGTEIKQSVWAHFPLYPLTVRAAENIFHLNFDYSAFILSLFFAISAFISFFLLCIYVFKLNEKESYIYTLFFMFFPFHYYFSMYYTEALFFTLLALAFVFISQKKYLVTSLLLIPLALVRPNGIISLLPLSFYYIEVEGGYKYFIKQFSGFNFKPLAKQLWFLSGPIALGLYMIFQYSMTGYYLAFVKAQAGWGKEFMFPLLGLFRRSDLASQFNSVYTIFFMIIAIMAWKKLPLSMNILIWISLLLPLASGSALCMPRYISTIFPLTVFIVSFTIQWKYVHWLLAFSLLLQLVTFYPWIISDPFSF